jgi:hypothetical protein
MIMTGPEVLLLLLLFAGLVIVSLHLGRRLRRPTSIRGTHGTRGRQLNPKGSCVFLPPTSGPGEPTQKPVKEDSFTALLGVAAVVVIGALAFKGLQKGYSFLKGLLTLA